MAEMPQRQKIGITHFPLSSEKKGQDKVARKKSQEQSGGPKNGHRLSRQQGATSEGEGAFAGKGGKGGKSRGARAGLLAANRKVRNRSRGGRGR
jgi:hypothetical protein